MTNPVVSDTTNAAKTLAQQIAQQMRKEPLEILKEVRSQAAPESMKREENSASPQQNNQDSSQELHNQLTQIDKNKSERLISAFNKELDDIRKQKIFKDLQARISAGEKIALHEYGELTMEQKQVLQAQMEAVAAQTGNQSQNFSDVPSISSKPNRRFGAGQKQAAQKEQTHVEKPVPPSG